MAMKMTAIVLIQHVHLFRISERSSSYTIPVPSATDSVR